MVDYVKWFKGRYAEILGMSELYNERVSVATSVELTEKGVIGRSELLEELFLKC